MKKLIWKPGIPVEDGVYWFDNGLRIGGRGKEHPSTLVFRNGYGLIFGAGGSCPLKCVYRKDVCPKAQYAEIPRPEPGAHWQKSINRGRHSWTWIKDPSCHIGFGLADYGYTEVYWVDWPGKGFHSGAISPSDTLYNPVQQPLIEISGGVAYVLSPYDSHEKKAISKEEHKVKSDAFNDNHRIEKPGERQLDL